MLPETPLPQEPAHSKRLTFTYRRATDLRPDGRNPRRHPTAQIRRIAKSMQTFGFLMPILINQDGRVVAGHGRLQAALNLGLEQVPTVQFDHLSEAQQRAYLLADNQLALSSTWDDKLLAEQLKELSDLRLDFDLGEALGFETGEIDFRIESLNAPDKPDPADKVHEPPSATRTQPGDLWLLDRHRVLCGNSLDEASYVLLMDGQKRFPK
jgi:ParB-like chromosome segregation protein Spo0J